MMRQVARTNPTAVGFDASPAKRQAKAEAGSVDASLLKCPEQVIDIAFRQTATFVQHLDEHAFCAALDAQRDGSTRPGEFEGVLQQVSDHGPKHLSIGVNH